MNNKRCELCEHYIPQVPGQGECHCVAPSPVVIQFTEAKNIAPYGLVLWPVVHASDYSCGEFRRG